MHSKPDSVVTTHPPGGVSTDERESRLTRSIRQASLDGSVAMGVFVTCGFPNAEATPHILAAIADAGADFIELGMPFSDPLAEGIPIQRSSERAILGGSTLDRVLSAAQTFTGQHDTPLVLMGYYNPILQYGLSNFCRNAESSGVDGLIIPDLPPEESGPLEAAASAHNLDLIFLVAPNTSADRVRQIDRRSTGFVYAVSTTGVTGGQIQPTDSIDQYLQTVADIVEQNPLLVGFGIRTPDDAVKLSNHTDGFIVGSAVISTIEALWDDETIDDSDRLTRLTAFVRSLKPPIEARPPLPPGNE
ncbi:MAG: tryptophan synthase subunit alpha [Rhodothermales bacterium]|nr:tryptophan synthase subunit alpha [Rhodothermales bacterium]